MLLLLAKYQVGMARSDTQDWRQSDIGQIFMIKHRKTKIPSPSDRIPKPK